VPTPADSLDGSLRRFIKPARVKWHAFTDGTTFTGFVFGSGSVLARIYNKSHQAKQKLDDAYLALLAERNPETFDPEQDVWRLEFQLRRLLRADSYASSLAHRRIGKNMDKLAASEMTSSALLSTTDRFMKEDNSRTQPVMLLLTVPRVAAALGIGRSLVY
jgi:hypothetical protein